MSKTKSDPFQNLTQRRESAPEIDEEVPAEYDTLLVEFRELQQRVRDQARLIATLQRESGADPLTGLANHNTLMAEIERSLATARRYGRRHALILLTIADFSNLSAQLGEQATDALLHHIASLIRQNIRPTDVAAHPRFGEFAIILNELRAVENATMRADEIADMAAQAPCMVGGRNIHCFITHACQLFGQDDTLNDIVARTRQSLAVSTSTPSNTVLS